MWPGTLWAEKKVYTYSFNTNNHLASSLYQELSVRGTTGNKISPCHRGVYVLVDVKVNISGLPKYTT